MWPQGVGGDLVPVGMPEHRRDRVGDEDQSQQEEDSLCVAIGAEEHQGPDHDGGDGHAEVARTPKSPKAVAMPPNSVTMRPTLAMAKATMANTVRRSENSSRIKAARPLPV